MEISVNQENLRFLQSYIRKFINDDQYEESLILTIQNEKEIITYKNDDLIIFLQDKKINENNYNCNVSLKKEYKYQFNYFNENITVIVNISKELQEMRYNDIFNFNWNNIPEFIYLQAPEMFINDIKYVFYLKNPDIENYCKENKHISETISFINDNNDDNDNLLKSFSANKNTDIKVYQLAENDFNYINTHIDKYLINIKIDGIRTLIVIVNNIIKCYQGDKKFIYNYNGPVIEGSYIFDCELCNGNLHIFDCWYACPDSSIYNSNFDIYKLLLKSNDGNDRISVINSFCEKYNFIKFNVLNIPECPINNITTDYRKFCNYIKEFVENGTLDDIINFKKSLIINGDFSQRYYDDLSKNIDEAIDIAKDVNKYNNKLYKMYSQNPTFKAEAYNLCMSFNIPQDIIHAYSPYIILGLIYYYYLIDFNDDNLIFKKYVYSNNFVENNKAYLKKPLTPTISMFYKDSQYPNDGLIFVNNSPIDFANNKTIYYKWKPKDKLSFDIKIDFDKDDVINIYETTQNYVLATFMNSQGNNIENSRIKIELNNFNRTLPCCKNGDIILSGDIVEIVPFYNGFITEYILLRIRYDKVKANGNRTIKTIKNYQTNYINLII